MVLRQTESISKSVDISKGCSMRRSLQMSTHCEAIASQLGRNNGSVFTSKYVRVAVTSERCSNFLHQKVSRVEHIISFFIGQMAGFKDICFWLLLHIQCIPRMQICLSRNISKSLRYLKRLQTVNRPNNEQSII